MLDINGAVEGMMDMLRRLIGEDISLEWRPGEDAWSVKVDPSQFHQVIVNLCVNARDAIAGVGTVTISTENRVLNTAECAAHPDASPGEYVCIIVSDTGCGMDTHTRSRLFEPFFTTKEVGQGTGMGLATVYGIVTQNKGFISVSSAPGDGATFSIHLPRSGQQVSADMHSEEAGELPEGSETILLVEDEPALLELGKEMLESLGYRVIAAALPDRAQEEAAACEEPIHALITDVIMPHMNGFDLSRALARARPEMACIYTSGYNPDVIPHRGTPGSDVFFIKKPFSIQELAHTVRAALDARTG